MGFDTFNVGPGWSTSSSRTTRARRRSTRAASSRWRPWTPPPICGRTPSPRSEIDGDPDRVRPPRGRPVSARDRHAVRPALDMADRTLTYRLIVKEIAKKAGYHATFHAEADLRRERLGHAHAPVAVHGRAQRVLRRRRPVAPERRREGAFIAGQLRHAQEIAAVFAQWVNSYKRLVPSCEAPVYVAWSRRNRSR